MNNAKSSRSTMMFCHRLEFKEKGEKVKTQTVFQKRRKRNIFRFLRADTLS